MVANEAAGKRKPEAYPPGYGEDFLRAENKVGGHFQPPLLSDGDELSDPRPKATGIPALNVDNTRPTESTDKAFARGKTRHPSRRGLLNIVGRCGRPGD